MDVKLRRARAHSHRRQQALGQSLPDYSILIAGIAVVVLVALAFILSPVLVQLYEQIVGAVSDVQQDGEMACVPPEENPGTYPQSADAGAHHFDISAWIYDEGSDSTTVGYMVTSGAKPSISHWVLVVPGCLDAGSVVSASELYEFVESDPKTGARGVKFDKSYENDESRAVFVTFHGRLEKGTGEVVVKASSQVHNGAIQAPGCEQSTPVCE